jgi:hypothetical protein
MADNLAEDEIDCRNLRHSRSRASRVALAAAEDNMMLVRVVVNVKVIELVDFGGRRDYSSSDGICL